MYLLIDNSDEKRAVFKYLLNDRWNQRIFPQAEKRSGSLLGSLDELLRCINKKTADLTGLAVVVGRGRFTAVRVAATIANTLAFALKIPAIGVKNAKTAALGERIAKAPAGRYISASYGGGAHIGLG